MYSIFGYFGPLGKGHRVPSWKTERYKPRYGALSGPFGALGALVVHVHVLGSFSWRNRGPAQSVGAGVEDLGSLFRALSRPAGYERRR